MILVFELDEVKSAVNKTKHGIDFLSAQALWKDDDLVIFPAKAVADEQRFGAIARLNDKHWTAYFTMRNENIRLISVRRSRKNEEEFYESQ
jgi:uncharacterized protein